MDNHRDYGGKRRLGVLVAAACAALLFSATGSALATALPDEFPPLPRPPIVIDGDDDWTTINGVVGGRGTADDPFVVSGWLIVGSASHGIRIANTSAHAVVRENVIAASYFAVAASWAYTMGIFLYNVTNVTVESNRLLNNHQAVEVAYSDNVTIAQNSIKGWTSAALSSVHGISLRWTTDSLVWANELEGLNKGIGLQESTRTVVAANELTDVYGYQAIGLFGSADVRIDGNVVVGCDSGTVLMDTARTTIEANVIRDCARGVAWDVGYHPTPSRGNVLRSNHIEGGPVGAELVTCADCLVVGNTFVGAETCLLLWRSTYLEANRFEACGLALRFISLTPTALRNNTFVDNGHNIWAQVEPADARLNWWGSAAGPDPDSLTGPVLYEPWLTQPPPSA